jgi:lipopolysaccharide biosynthesis glycosyltransferase
MDTDAIRAIPDLVDLMEDVGAAAGFPTVDQDRINLLFKGRITHLDPAWNCSWGRLKLQRKHQGELPTTAKQTHPMVVHFHGPHKPWHPLRISSLSRGATAVWRYRRDMATFRRRFPDIPDHLPK